jgi:hypothetical protein
MNTPKKPEAFAPIRLTASDARPTTSIRVRSALRAGITIKQKVTEN